MLFQADSGGFALGYAFLYHCEIMMTTTLHSLFYVAVCQVQTKEDEDLAGTTNTVGIAEPKQPCSNNLFLCLDRLDRSPKNTVYT